MTISPTNDSQPHSNDSTEEAVYLCHLNSDKTPKTDFVVRQPRGLSLAEILPIFIPIIVQSVLNRARHRIYAGSGIVGVARVKLLSWLNKLLTLHK